MHAGTEKLRAKKAVLELQMQQREVLDDIPEPSSDDVITWWENTSDARRKDVVSVILDHVTVLPADGRRDNGSVVTDRLQHAWKTA
ncbi:hypothetical protein ACQKGB_29125 [Bacillus tropicus]|uniref:hypothetical protein n=1 Tax=Bacillus tropicus TaxID=2026188 RepID=UPI003D090EAD